MFQVWSTILTKAQFFSCLQKQPTNVLLAIYQIIRNLQENTWFNRKTSICYWGWWTTCCHQQFWKKKHQLHQCSFFMLPVFQLISISSWPHLVTPPNKTQGPWFLIDSHTWKPGTRPFHHPQSSTDFTVLVALRSQLKSKAAAPATWMSQPNNLTQWGAILGHLRYPKTQ